MVELSIVDHIRDRVGIDVSDGNEDFLNDVISRINSSIAVLYQLGAFESGHFPVILDPAMKWQDLKVKSKEILPFVQEAIYLRTKMVFDPPASSVIKEAYEKELKEMEWRICEYVES